MSDDFVPQTNNSRQTFDVFAEIRRLPETSESMLTDIYFSDFPQAGSRIFRIYRALGLHYHNDCDEHLYVVSVDVPRRRPDDIVFVDPEHGDARSFMPRTPCSISASGEQGLFEHRSHHRCCLTVQVSLSASSW
jgi:hypothetical protein